MKQIYLSLIFLISILAMACVDDFEDANPPRQLDAPAGFLAVEGGDLIVDENDGTYALPKGGKAQVKISIVDAPGVIDSASYRLVNSIQPESLGTASVDISAVKGKETGTAVLEYTAGSVSGKETIEFIVYDAQSPRKSQIHSVEIEIL